VERDDNSGYGATVLGGSANDGPRSCEVEPSEAPYRAVDTLPGQSTIRTSPTEGLPPPTTKRWVVRRKAAVVAAVRSGDMTIEEACRVYQLSEEEFLSWQRAFENHGLAGLRVTRIQQYRRFRSARAAPSASPKRRVEPNRVRQATPSEVS
jgi:transposase-like protein